MQLIFDLIKYQGNIPLPSPMYAFIYYFCQVMGLIFCLMYFHQTIYIIVGSFKHFKFKGTNYNKHKYGIVISARNESKVIANLINSIKASDYPQDLLKIFVIADNCTDNTAQICRDMGCIVFERFNKEKVGKGYALNFLFTKLHTEPEFADIIPEAYIVLDADNVIKPDFITEMNKAYDSGYEMATSYRNSKNMGKNWISAGYGYWFMHEARHLNNSRMMLNSSCAISGTGFLVSSKVVKEYDNWNFFMLTEDIQCSTEYALSGRQVAYVSTAELYDEQPETFRQAWRQRERWAKGFYQVFGKNGGKLLKGSFKNFACWDILTTIFPALIITMLMLIVMPICAVISLFMGEFYTAWYAIESVLWSFGSLGILMLIIGATIALTEWKKIKTSNWKKILYIFTLPIFMFTYIPIAIAALFKKVEWKPITHTANVSIEELETK